MKPLVPLKAMALGLFEKRIDGDDCLLELARRRFQQAGLGAEMHAGTPEQLEWLLGFRPTEESPVIVHLPRDLNLADERSRNRVVDFAGRFAGRIRGLVLHDHAAMAVRRKDYVDAARVLEVRLRKIDRCPVVFMEYAAGLNPDDFARFFGAIRDLERISACIDIGHVGIRQARVVYADTHTGEDICELKSQGARLPQLMADVETAVAGGAAAVLDLIEALGTLGKPLHFHLHDCHPLSTFSPFGVADHLGFLTQIPLNFEYRGRWSVPPMFGPAGLAKLMARAVETAGVGNLSFTLEIHPTGERLSLDDAAPLFAHWTDKANAEKMNHWLSVLARNHSILQEAMR